MNLRYQEGWTNLFCRPSPMYWGKEGGGCRPACPGELGCFHQKAPPSVGRSWKAQVVLIAICTPLFTKYTLSTLFCWFFFRNVTELYELHNDTCFLSVMSETLRITQLFPLWLLECYGTLRIAHWRFLSTPDMSWNFTDCLTMGVKCLEVVKRRSHPNKQMVPGRN